MQRLPDWEADNHLSGHSSPAFAPNLLNLLADQGVSAGDDARVEGLLDSFLDRQDPDGRFLSFGTSRAFTTPVWGSLLCDTHAITEVLIRFGRAEDPAVVRAMCQMAADRANTPQDLGWPCLPTGQPATPRGHRHQRAGRWGPGARGPGAGGPEAKGPEVGNRA